MPTVNLFGSIEPIAERKIHSFGGLSLRCMGRTTGGFVSLTLVQNRQGTRFCQSHTAFNRRENL